MTSAKTINFTLDLFEEIVAFESFIDDYELKEAIETMGLTKR